MFETKNPFRPVQGVRRNEVNTVSTEQAPTNTIVACMPLEMYGVMYGDDSGRAHRTVFVRMGGQWYEAPNSETWAGGLRPVLSKFTEQLESIALAQKDKSVPKSDSVDIMGE